MALTHCGVYFPLSPWSSAAPPPLLVACASASARSRRRREGKSLLRWCRAACGSKYTARLAASQATEAAFPALRSLTAPDVEDRTVLMSPCETRVAGTSHGRSIRRCRARVTCLPHAAREGRPPAAVTPCSAPAVGAASRSQRPPSPSTRCSGWRRPAERRIPRARHRQAADSSGSKNPRACRRCLR